MTNQFVLVYITCANANQAENIGKALVEKKLAACTNLVGKISSCYFWNGELQNSEEALLLAKCRQQHLPKIYETVKSIHTYTVPAIVAIPILEGSPEYMNWLQNELPDKQPLEAPDGE